MAKQGAELGADPDVIAAHIDAAINAYALEMEPIAVPAVLHIETLRQVLSQHVCQPLGLIEAFVMGFLDIDRH